MNHTRILTASDIISSTISGGIILISSLMSNSNSSDSVMTASAPIIFSISYMLSSLDSICLAMISISLLTLYCLEASIESLRPSRNSVVKPSCIGLIVRCILGGNPRCLDPGWSCTLHPRF